MTEDPAIKQAVDRIEYKRYHDLLFDEGAYDWFAVIEEVKKQFLSIVVDVNQLAKVTILSQECADVHSKIMPNWSGETEEFDPHTLHGLSAMTGLEHIEFINFQNISDFSPLYALPNLKTIRECHLPISVIERLLRKGIAVR